MIYPYEISFLLSTRIDELFSFLFQDDSDDESTTNESDICNTSLGRSILHVVNQQSAHNKKVKYNLNLLEFTLLIFF